MISKTTFYILLYGLSFITASFVALYTGSIVWGIFAFVLTTGLLFAASWVSLTLWLQYQMKKFTREMGDLIAFMDGDQGDDKFINDMLNEWSEENDAE